MVYFVPAEQMLFRGNFCFLTLSSVFYFKGLNFAKICCYLFRGSEADVVS